MIRKNNFKFRVLTIGNILTIVILILLSFVAVDTYKPGNSGDLTYLYNYDRDLFGRYPVKFLDANAAGTDKELIACGTTIGVKINLEGVLVIGLSDVEAADGAKTEPSRDAGIKTGDILVDIDGDALNNIEHLIQKINSSQGKELNITYKRDGALYTAPVLPVKSDDDNLYHIGLWVRDSSAGIGTLTYYDPEDGSYGALGHGITDIDTSTVMQVKNGELMLSDILSIKKSEAGSPGELKGILNERDGGIGSVVLNFESGIFGVIYPDKTAILGSRKYQIAHKNQIKEGPATILAGVEGDGVKEYAIEILRVSRNSTSGTKSMIVKITDEKLLELTGGIVQGMSGCPIIQDNRLVGAITHVFVNDPTKGYGIFIENMLENDEANTDEYKKAG